MRFFTLFILSLFSSVISAQIEVETSFDFNNPRSLTPAVTPSPDHLGRVSVTDKVFSQNGLALSFQQGAMTGAEIRTNVASQNTSYKLVITDGTSMTLTLEEGISLKSISLGENSVNGGLSLVNNQPGNYSMKKWTSTGDEVVKSVSFRASGNNTEITSLNIVYTVEENILEPTADITGGAVLPEFKLINLAFTEDMQIVNTSGITIQKEGEEESSTLTAAVDGKVVTLSSVAVIATDGTYTITVPAHCFKNAKGFYNKELKYTFSINIPKNTLEYSAVSPEMGLVKSIPLTFSLTYTDNVGFAKGEVDLVKDGESIGFAKISKVDDHTVQIDIQNRSETLQEEGIYSLRVAEHSICNSWHGSENHKADERWNPEFTLNYQISNAPVKTETYLEAEKLLKNEGVGYPSANSESRKALKALIDLIQTETPPDADLKEKMAAFYAETDVTLPEAGKYYTIASVNAEGGKLYLSKTDDGVVLDNKIKNAASFEVEQSESGSLYFKTSDGKYLHVLVGNTINEVNATNLTDQLDENLNSLNFKKIVTVADQNVDSKSLFGLLYMSGSAGKNAVGKESSLNALVDHSSKSIKSSIDITDLYFNNKLSSAFVIEEVLGPVEIEATLSPKTVATNKETLTLTWAEDKNIVLSDADAPYFADAKGVKVVAAKLLQKEGSKTEYEVSLAGLEEADYQLVIPEGTFSCKENGKDRNVKAVTLTFKIYNQYGDGDDARLQTTYEPIYVYNDVEAQAPIKDIWLNDFTIYVYKSQFTGLCVNPQKTVKLFDIRNQTYIAEGTFVETTLPGKDDVWAVKVNFNTPIKEGSLHKNYYRIEIEKGTIGDANFGKYLKDKSTVDPSDCQVNPNFTFTYYVNNAEATGIEHVGISDNRPVVIYDLNGRRVQDMSRPGIYIVNGKKIVSK